MNRLTRPIPTPPTRERRRPLRALLNHDATWLALLAALVLAVTAILHFAVGPAPAPERLTAAWLFGGALVIGWLALRSRGL